MSLNWDDVDDATHYLVRWRVAGPGNKLNEGVETTSSNVDITVAGYGEWIARVQACNGAGCGRPLTKRFRVEGAPEPKPAGLTVATNQDSLDVSLHWGDIDSATYYWVRWRVAGPGNKLNEGVETTSSNANITVSGYGEWIARVQACDDEGCVKPMTARFNVEQTSTPAPTPEPTPTPAPTPEPTSTPAPTPEPTPEGDGGSERLIGRKSEPTPEPIILARIERTFSVSSDRAALIELHDNAGGVSWKDRENWLSDKPLGKWYGVKTNSAVRVTHLLLGENRLSGSIPSSLGDLSELNYLDLGSNQLSGSIPASLGDLSNLLSLGLSGNNLTGQIPPSLGNLSKLRGLSLNFNNLTGRIPGSLGDLSNLTWMWIGHNPYRGCIPTELAGWVDAAPDVPINDLHHMMLVEGMHLCIEPVSTPEGPQPEQIDKAALVAFYDSTDGEKWRYDYGWGSSLPIDEWVGVVAVDIGYVSRINLSRNGLSGRLPSQLGNMTYLRRLYLGENELSGSIPPSVGDLYYLEELYLNGNQLDGSIPASMSDMWNLRRLLLGDNQLNGSIPAELGDLENLVLLSIYDNELSGEIPPALGNIDSLWFLNLRNNNLSGSIPAELVNLDNLRYLYLAGNNFTGCIPNGLDSSLLGSDLKDLELPDCEE